ncbi:hypothetical protein DPEC_G00297860 [Dallia pectoralis]|uniref:Uncharacterized protein n=1 Tax=Dallia pectoralis TaxID=75939 RepID=A0ACC2FFN3_DALPE|nr:hypothetical protein DPEC_G00297860 [Dallia pectoralis]
MDLTTSLWPSPLASSPPPGGHLYNTSQLLPRCVGVAQLLPRDGEGRGWGDQDLYWFSLVSSRWGSQGTQLVGPPPKPDAVTKTPVRLLERTPGLPEGWASDQALRMDCWLSAIPMPHPQSPFPLFHLLTSRACLSIDADEGVDAVGRPSVLVALEHPGSFGSGIAQWRCPPPAGQTVEGARDIVP